MYRCNPAPSTAKPLPVHMLRLVCLCLLLGACALTGRFDAQKHGLVIGSVLVEQPQQLGVQEVHLQVRSTRALLIDAINIYARPGENKRYTTILPAGDYEFTALRVRTGALYQQIESPLPLNFSLKAGERLMLGQLLVRLHSQPDVLGHVLNSQVTLVATPDDSLNEALEQTYPKLPTGQLTSRSRQLLDAPHTIELRKISDDDWPGCAPNCGKTGIKHTI